MTNQLEGQRAEAGRWLDGWVSHSQATHGAEEGLRHCNLVGLEYSVTQLSVKSLPQGGRGRGSSCDSVYDDTCHDAFGNSLPLQQARGENRQLKLGQTC